jgi:hypothetical protein
MPLRITKLSMLAQLHTPSHIPVIIRTDANVLRRWSLGPMSQSTYPGDLPGRGISHGCGGHDYTSPSRIWTLIRADPSDISLRKINTKIAMK